MTEQEAIKQLQENIDLAFGSSVSNEASELAIKALEEMAKIKEMGDCYIIPKNGVWEVNGVDIHKAIEKQIAKKPVETMICNTATWKCPCCGNELYSGQEYCDECGQAILDDWDRGNGNGKIDD